MSLDGAFLRCVVNELMPLVGGRVDKIHQPSREEIIITIRSSATKMLGTKKLLFSANSSAARVSLTTVQAENPKTPPMFCMLLRKHLGSGRLINITQDGLERIVNFEFECTNEIGDTVTNSVIIEVMGRHSNIILTSNGKIIDAIKRIDDEISSVRRVLPGSVYQNPPKKDRLCLLNCQDDDVKKALTLAHNDKLHKVLINIFEGISPIFARECVYYACRDIDFAKDDLSENQIDRLLFFLRNAKNAIINSNAKYTVVNEIFKDKQAKPKDFSFVNIEQYNTHMLVTYKESPSDLLDSFFGSRDIQERMKQKTGELLKMLMNTYERIDRKIKLQEQELEECVNKDKYKIMGDLLNANLYRLKKGDTNAVLENFYENNDSINIPLDIRLTPAQNAQKYYAEYRKLVNAEKMLQTLIENGKSEMLYIDSVFDAATRITGENEILEIRTELIESGYLKKNKIAMKAVKSAPPLRFTSTDGFTIYVGRNNKQNDKLTTKDAKSTDLWLHTQNIPGSHVIISSDGQTIPDSTIEQAAVLAAYCSKARESAMVPVDYTLVKYVKKPNGAKPGMVIFTNNKTAFVSPSEELYKKLIVN